MLVWALIFIGVAFAFKQSRRGLRLRASRENVRAAKSVGVRVSVERAVAWVLSGFVVGVAGALYGHYFVTFGPDDFFFNQGFNIVLLTIVMLVVGGMTSVTGAVVGCYFVTVIYETFRRWEINGLDDVRPPSGTANFVLAVVLVLTLVLRPNGITGGREITWPGSILDPLRRLARRARSSGRGFRRRRVCEVTSVMRATIWRQPDDLKTLLADVAPVESQAERLGGRRLVVVGTGTSWHAANHAVWLFREAGVEAVAVQAMDAAQYGLPVRDKDARPRHEPPEHEALLDRGAGTRTRCR